MRMTKIQQKMLTATITLTLAALTM
ncbi:hypothetical protein CABS01_16411 [Colletotrichum abscissum]|nr:hypothetical protein CABS01_16411 [Colletotrichum abscissum]